MNEMIKMLKNDELVDRAIESDRKKKAADTELKVYQSEIQKRGLSVIEDRNIKQTKFYGNTDNNIAEITFAQKLQIINSEGLHKMIGSIFDENVEKAVVTTYKANTKLSEVLKAIFTDDYISDMSLNEVLDKCFELDNGSKELLKKKLKGTYDKDKETIAAILGKDSKELDIDVELDYIHKALMWEKIKKFFPADTKDTIENIKNFITVEKTPKISLKYEA